MSSATSGQFRFPNPENLKQLQALVEKYGSHPDTTLPDGQKVLNAGNLFLLNKMAQKADPNVVKTVVTTTPPAGQQTTKATTAASTALGRKP